jgi:hypothetical protein
MKNLAKTGFYASAGILLTAIHTANAAIEVGTVNQDIVTAGSADQVVQGYIANALGFLYLVAVVFAIWGGFNILTAAGDEEKVKKGKTVIIQALIWIVVIFLAGTVVEWLTKAILA